MNIIQKVFKRLRLTKKNNFPTNFKTEEAYYTYFFTKHPKWSKKEPNKAERTRWQEIEKLLVLVRQNVENAPLSIIDFGCGRGWLSNELAKYGSVTGIEPVAAVVKYAQKLYPTVNFEVGSISSLQGKSANLVVSSEVVEHISVAEQPAYFQSFYEVLQPNGYCIITTPRAEVQDEWMLHSNMQGQPKENWLLENEVKELAINAGFKKVAQTILKEYVNGENTPLLNMYQIWLFQKC